MKDKMCRIMNWGRCQKLYVKLSGRMNQEKQIMDKLVQQIFMVDFGFIFNIICSSKGTEVSLHIPQDSLDVCS